MKKIARLLTVVVLLFVGGSTFAQKGSRNARLPDSMTFISLDNVIVTKKDLPKNKPLLLIYFDPECGHCQFMAKRLAKRLILYPNIPVWMVSNYPAEAIKDFVDSTGLYPAFKLTMLRDFTLQMHDWFSFDSVPLMLLFDKKGHLIKELNELPTADKLRHLIGQ